MPSAVTFIPRVWLSETMARTISVFSPPPVCARNDLSIFNVSMGKCCRQLIDE